MELCDGGCCCHGAFAAEAAARRHEDGVNGAQRSSVIPLPSDQLSLLLMQMFGLEAEGLGAMCHIAVAKQRSARICVGTCLVAVGQLIV